MAHPLQQQELVSVNITTSTPTSYHYVPLPSPRHIRLLEVSGCSDHDAALTGNIRVVDLEDDDALPYVALSYTWGQSASREDLLLDGSGVLRITPSLASALRQFRYASAVRWIWADAVCINQDDDAEKSRQIPLMPDIYRGASRVMAWLGDQPRDTEVLRRVKGWATEMNRVTDGERHNAINEDKMSSSLARLGRLPYFTRRWIIQEVALNPNIVLCCGQIELPWPQLPLVDYWDIDTVDTGLRKILLLWDLWLDTATCIRRNTSIPKSRYYFDGNDDHLTPRSIATLMDCYSDTECSNGHDRIAGLIGLATDTNIFQVNYTDSVEKTYVDFAQSLASKGLLAWLLDQKFRRATEKDNEEEGLPSWVPDWRARVNNQLTTRIEFMKTRCSIQPSSKSSGLYLLKANFMHLEKIDSSSRPENVSPSGFHIAHDSYNELDITSLSPPINPTLFEVAWKSVLLPKEANLGQRIVLTFADIWSCLFSDHEEEDWGKLLLLITMAFVRYGEIKGLRLQAPVPSDFPAYPGKKVVIDQGRLKRYLEQWRQTLWLLMGGSKHATLADGLLFCISGNKHAIKTNSSSSIVPLSAVFHQKVKVGDKVLFANLGALRNPPLDMEWDSLAYIVREHLAATNLKTENHPPSSDQWQNCMRISKRKDNCKLEDDDNISSNPHPPFVYEFIAPCESFHGLTKWDDDEARDYYYRLGGPPRHYNSEFSQKLFELRKHRWGKGIKLVKKTLSIWIR